MELNDEVKAIVEELGQAINKAVERSAEVAAAIERVREAGYEAELKLRLQIGLRQVVESEEETGDFSSATTFEFTDEDRRTLRRMKIRIDEPE